MWESADVRKLLLASAKPDQPSGKEKDSPPKRQPVEIRLKALGTLASIATAPPIRESMWCDKVLARVLMNAAKERGEVHSEVIRILLELARHEANHGPMAEQGVPDVFDIDA